MHPMITITNIRATPPTVTVRRKTFAANQVDVLWYGVSDSLHGIIAIKMAYLHKIIYSRPILEVDTILTLLYPAITGSNSDRAALFDVIAQVSL